MPDEKDHDDDASSLCSFEVHSTEDDDCSYVSLDCTDLLPESIHDNPFDNTSDGGHESTLSFSSNKSGPELPILPHSNKSKLVPYRRNGLKVVKNTNPRIEKIIKLIKRKDDKEEMTKKYRESTLKIEVIKDNIKHSGEKHKETPWWKKIYNEKSKNINNLSPPDRSHQTNRVIGFDENVIPERLNRGPVEFEVRVAREVNAQRVSPLLYRTDFSQKGCGGIYERPTGLCCFWCSEPCDCVPVARPVKEKLRAIKVGYCKEEYVAYYSVSGIYCSMNCMIADAKRRKVNEPMLKRFMNKVYDIPLMMKIEPALPMHALDKFGGFYSTEAYRATSKQGIKSTTYEPGLIPLSTLLEENEKITATVTKIVTTEDEIESELVTQLVQLANPTQSSPKSGIDMKNTGRMYSTKQRRTNHGTQSRSPPKRRKLRAKKQPRQFNKPHEIVPHGPDNNIDTYIENLEQKHRLEMKHFDVDGEKANKRPKTMKDFMCKK